MNKIDDILEQLKGQQPMIDDPDALTERIMNSLPDLESGAVEVEQLLQQQERRSRIVPLRRWVAIAASLILLIGVGAMVWMHQDDATQPAPMVAKVEKPSKAIQETVAAPVVAEVEAVEEKAPKAVATILTEKAKEEKVVVVETPEEDDDLLPDEDPNIHYAAYELTQDTLPYQDPARVDDFIAQLADYNNVKQGKLTCSAPLDSNMVSAVYVFPDKKEIDVLGRLLQVACWYDSKTPGYHLNFSQQQFFFELKDMRHQLQYRWIAERINGRILFYSTHAPIGAKESSACYQEYRDELMYNNSINLKPKKI